MRIHIIEDDLAVSDALATVLSVLGHAPLCYPDAESFLAKPAPASEDLVIVDLGLPGIGGEEVVRRLELSPEPPRVIVISGHSKSKLERKLPQFASMTVLRKPLSFPALAEHLN
ncbi:response regulator [Roseibium polysiphoniae]|uniref:Response regulator n=1 Tax=Roseibium polysiphoniae TaxID=2571221 RepID=A0A944CEF3_9HYPH|nr:response regulator [Roseibium polysiphoniae]